MYYLTWKLGLVKHFVNGCSSVVCQFICFFFCLFKRYAFLIKIVLNQITLYTLLKWDLEFWLLWGPSEMCKRVDKSWNSSADLILNQVPKDIFSKRHLNLWRTSNLRKDLVFLTIFLTKWIFWNSSPFESIFWIL